jgi:hypothetical protein
MKPSMDDLGKIGNSCPHAEKKQQYLHNETPDEIVDCHPFEIENIDSVAATERKI